MIVSADIAIHVSGAQVRKVAAHADDRYSFAVEEPLLPYVSNNLYLTGTLEDLNAFADRVKAAVAAVEAPHEGTFCQCGICRDSQTRIDGAA